MKKILPQNAHLIPDNAQKVFEGEIFEVYQWPQKMFDGSKATFEMLKRPDTVTVIPVASGKILAVEDEQPYTGKKLSFPGGRVDAEDSSTLDAAQREVKEETGYEFNSWKLLNVTQPHAKLEWFIYFYLASDVRKNVEPHLDAGEKITLKEISFDEAKTFVAAKSGHLGESEDIFKQAANLDELLNLPEFSAKEIER